MVSQRLCLKPRECGTTCVYCGASLSFLRCAATGCTYSHARHEPVRRSSIWPGASCNGKVSDGVVSSVSPERCEVIDAYRARCAISTASSVSVRVPIWLTLTSSVGRTHLDALLQALRVGHEQASSPTSCTLSPMRWVSETQASHSSSESGSDGH